MRSLQGQQGSEHVPAQVVGLAGSAGGLSAFCSILSGLPASFAAPILAVMHMERHRPNQLVHLMSRCTALQVVQAEDGMLLDPGVVFVAPPDHHLLVSASLRVRLSHASLVHFVRPAADELFFSLAEIYGAAAAGVLCSGGGVDGGAGLQAIHRAGGTTIVQDPATIQHAGMPKEAIRLGAATLILPLSQIPHALLEVVKPLYPPI